MLKFGVAVLGAMLTSASLAQAQAPAPTLEYYHVDALGSVRAVTNAQGQVVRSHDYHPFGEGVGTEAGQDPLRFTGKPRDEETGLDYFGARSYGMRWGRFTAVDPLLSTDAAKIQPQRWNRYAYVQNNPLRYFDPDGRCSAPSGVGAGQIGICVEAFISKKWFSGVGRGDNRTFSGTDPELTARSRIKLVVDGRGTVVSSQVESARSGILIKGLGFRGDTVADAIAQRKNDGSTSVHVDLWGRNGEAFLAPLAPAGVLEGHFNFNISASGEISFITAGSSATTFPSWGIYAYGPDGRVITLWQSSENVIGDLKNPPRPIK
jgi:RHS repeat-associated protein